MTFDTNSENYLVIYSNDNNDFSCMFQEWEPLRNIVPNSFLTSEEPKSADSVLTTLQPFYEIIVEESDTNIQDE